MKMVNSIRAKVTKVRDEIVVSAADEDLIGRELREGILHLSVKPDFYGEIKVSEEFLKEALAMCTIGNFVGKHTISMCVDLGLIDPENIIEIDGIPHAQFARMIR